MLTYTNIESQIDSVHDSREINDFLDSTSSLNDLDICKMYASFLMRDTDKIAIDNMSEGALYAMRSAYETIHFDCMS